MSLLAEGTFPRAESINWLCQCGGQMRVLDSRPTTFYGAHAVRRRRCCVKCNVRSTTIEVTRDNPLIETLERAQGIVGSAVTLSAKLRKVAGDIDEAVARSGNGAAA